MATDQPEDADEKPPQLAYISAVDPGEKLTNKLTGIFQKILHGQKHDALGELAVTLIQPEDVSKRYNGGAWIEGFDRIQTPHTHKNDDQFASERYLLVLPVGANGVVDLTNPNCDMERYIFEKDKLHLLHFDGATQHRFSIMGGNRGQEKGAKLYAIAIHSRDVATSLNALIEQTDICPDFPKWDTKSLVVAPPDDKPKLGDNTVDQIIRKLDAANLEHVATKPEAGRALANTLSTLALHVAKQGIGYGNAEKFSDIGSLKKWTVASVEHPSVSGRR